MSQTVDLMGALLARLQEHFGRELMAELFPEAPAQYRLNHSRGSILVAYGRSQFGNSEATNAVFQERRIVIRLTLVFRQLNGKDGVISYLDRIREVLTGWYPPHCDAAVRPIAEQFLGQVQGIWQYAQDFSVRATQLQVVPQGDQPLLTQTNYEHEGFP